MLWSPRRVVLSAPLTLTNLLPCALHLRLEQRGGGALPVAVGSDGDGAATVDVCLAPGRTTQLHSLHLLQGAKVHAALWVGGDSYDDARLHGHTEIVAPAHGAGSRDRSESSELTDSFASGSLATRHRWRRSIRRVRSSRRGMCAS